MWKPRATLCEGIYIVDSEVRNPKGCARWKKLLSCHSQSEPNDRVVASTVRKSLKRATEEFVVQEYLQPSAAPASLNTYF